MPKFQVFFDESIIVEAEDEQEAIEQAIAEFDFGSIHPYAENLTELENDKGVKQCMSYKI